ncbi:hypothetical protein GCM10009789_14570 [Kribbella sancticallisti]|uniref:Proteasome-type protease n=1 Tax=Kribbella sancticallisti TaxID=460087 RepID=A0ABP4NLX2_9ACTN
MTVAVGLVCSDGVLVASDSMATGEGVAAHSIKVRQFGRSPIIWTAAGSVFVMEEVTTVLEKEDLAGTPEAPKAAYTKPDLPAIRNSLHTPINTAMRKAYAKELYGPPSTDGQLRIMFRTDFLMLGHANDTSWFLEFAGDGQVNWHTDARFYAVGSGGPYATVAHALMSHYIGDGVTLEQGKLIAYRAIQTTIEVSPSGVGLPVQMAICDNSGARILEKPELDQIGFAVDGWKVLERETLTQSVAEKVLDAAQDLPVMDEEAPVQS